jgi:hypothetical protein
MEVARQTNCGQSKKRDISLPHKTEVSKRIESGQKKFNLRVNVDNADLDCLQRTLFYSRLAANSDAVGMFYGLQPVYHRF